MNYENFMNMHGLLILFLLIGSLITPAFTLVKEAIAADSVTLQLYDPTGVMEISNLHAARLNTLEGKTICELSIDAWQAHRTLPLIRKLLQERFPKAKFIPYTDFPIGSKEGGIDSDETADLVAKKGCQAVIIGNAG